MIEFFGRLHPLVVHLPIGILLLAAGFNFLSRFKKYKSLSGTSYAALFFGAITAVLACVSGIAKSDSSYDINFVSQHKYLGIITAFLSLMILLFSNFNKVFKKRLLRNIKSTLYLVLVPLIIVTGHFGGTLTHGSEFLTIDLNDKVLLPPVSAVFNPDSSIYSQLIRPLFQDKCYACHSSRKQKGKLRLDSEVFIRKGGKSGPVIAVDDSGESELSFRIHLPIEDEDHMPPSDNEQLTSGEIDLLTSWIESGASFQVKLAECQDSLMISQYIAAKFGEKRSIWWPTDTASPVNEVALAELRNLGVTAELLSEESNYIQASFISLDSIPKTSWASLLKLKENLIAMRFSGVKLTQLDINNLSLYPLLRKLYLDQSLNDSLQLQSIFNLSELRYLNLAGNAIHYGQISDIEKLENLEDLILFNTNVSEKEVDRLKKELPKCKIEFEPYTLQELPGDTLIYRKKSN